MNFLRNPNQLDKIQKPRRRPSSLASVVLAQSMLAPDGTRYGAWAGTRPRSRQLPMVLKPMATKILLGETVILQVPIRNQASPLPTWHHILSPPSQMLIQTHFLPME